MSEIVSLYIGGAGVNIGKEVLSLYAKEHGLAPDGFQLNDEAPEDSLENVANQVHFSQNIVG